MFEMQTARIAAEQQSGKSKLHPLIPNSFAVGVFYVGKAAAVPCPLQGKLKAPIKVFSQIGPEVEVPMFSRFLRRTACAAPSFLQGGSAVGAECFEVAVGFPWSYETFMKKAIQVGHPTDFCKLVPMDIQDAMEFHAS